MKEFYLKVLSLLGKIPQDKLLHFSVAMILTMITLAIPIHWVKECGCFVVCVLAFLKEAVLDSYLGLGTYDVKDLLWSMFGALIPWFIFAGVFGLV